MEKYATFFLDKSACWKASMPVFQQADLSRKPCHFFPVHTRTSCKAHRANKNCQGENLLVWTALYAGPADSRAIRGNEEACILSPVHDLMFGPRGCRAVRVTCIERTEKVCHTQSGVELTSRALFATGNAQNWRCSSIYIRFCFPPASPTPLPCYYRMLFHQKL